VVYGYVCLMMEFEEPAICFFRDWSVWRVIIERIQILIASFLCAEIYFTNL
jgi:hypothetical protein